jgi:hypothetical protein
VDLGRDRRARAGDRRTGLRTRPQGRHRSGDHVDHIEFHDVADLRADHGAADHGAADHGTTEHDVDHDHDVQHDDDQYDVDHHDDADLDDRRTLRSVTAAAAGPITAASAAGDHSASM